jgi:curli biogenesis system outer membrane secretion channel CsgG
MRIQLAAALGAVLAVVALASTGCATKGTQITDEEIGAARSNGTLEALYARVQAELQAEGSRPSERTLAVKAQIGSLLAESLEGDVEKRMAADRLPNGRLPLASIEAIRNELAPMAQWDPERGGRLDKQIATEESQTRAAMDELQTRLSGLADDAYEERLQAVDGLAALAGPGGPDADRWSARREELLTALNTRVDAAIQAEQFSDAQRMLQVARQISPGDATIDTKLASVDAQLFEKRFWKALEDGDPEGAYKMLRDIAKADNFAAIQPRLAASADPMAKFFVALASDATSKGNLPDAYRWFSRARSIRRLLGQEQASVLPEEAPFVDMVKQQYWDARKDKRPALAWAYLSVVNDLEPSSPSLRRMVRETHDEVLELAVKRVAAQPFQDSTAGHQFGENVSSLVVQELLERIPQDVKIIEREELENILREKEIGKESTTSLAAADYLIQGDILEAKVDTNEKKGRKTVRVTTDTVTEQNPAYLRWLELSEKERSKIEAPPQQITKEQKEDVSIDVTLHKKVGVFAVSYRVVDADSAKVIFADSLREKEEHEDTSTEGVEIGNFKMPFKLAQLPSDTEILSKLADTVSKEIGERLAKVLADPEDRYAEAARRYLDEGNYTKACTQFAYADVLSQRKGKDTGDLDDEMRTAAMQTIERPKVASESAGPAAAKAKPAKAKPAKATSAKARPAKKAAPAGKTQAQAKP